MPNELLAPSFLFRFALPCLRIETPWPHGGPLDQRYSLPALQSLDDAPARSEIRAAWNDSGLSFSVLVAGKKQAPWCRENRLEESDGFHLWLDTRDTHNIHRAGRFCHRFVFLPTGGGPRLDDPVADQMLINRARENAQPVRPGALRVVSKKLPAGYSLDCHLPAGALTGWDPAEHPRLGFMYLIADREIGEQSLAYGREFPLAEDPSVWCTLELVR